MRDVEWGWLIRYMHSTGASAFFIVVYLHMFRALLYGSYQKPRELLWIFGMLIYLALMAEAFFGYLLPWGNMSYWGAQVIVSLFGAIPVDRRLARRVDPRRLLHLRRHAEPLLRAARGRAAAGAGVPGDRAPDGAARGRLEQSRRRRDQEGQGAGRHPARRHPVPSVLHGQGHGRRRRVPDPVLRWSSSSRRPSAATSSSTPNFEPANPLQTPPHIAPVWYFTPFYAILRAVPNKPLGRRADGRRRACCSFLPWLDRSQVKSIRYRGPIFKFALAAVRDQLPRARLPRHAAGRRRPTPMLARVFTVVYFAFFLLMPWYTSIDKTKPVPERVTYHAH